MIPVDPQPSRWAKHPGQLHLKIPLVVLLVIGCILLQIVIHQATLPLLGKNLSVSVALALGILVPATMVVWWVSRNVATTLRLKGLPASPALAVIGLAIGFALLASGSVELLMQMGRLPPTIVRLLEQEERLFREAFSFAGPLDAFTLGLALIVLAPLSEELLFRGLLQGSLEHRLGGWPAVIISALSFAMLHGPLRFLPMGFLGILLGYAVRRTNSLFAGILAHAANNALVLILSFAAEAGLLSRAWLVAAVALGGLGLLASLRLLRSWTVRRARIAAEPPPRPEACPPLAKPNDQLWAGPF